MTREHLVIIGTGMAAMRLMEELDKQCPDRFTITAIGKEPELPYNRILLSPLLAGEVAREALDLQPEQWFSERGLKLIRGLEVLRLEPDHKRLVLSNNATLTFDRCVLATGSQPIVLPLPGADKQGVTTFRHFADLTAILERSGPGCKAAVIGGGLLGLETAYGLQKQGADVTVVHVCDRLMERQLDGVGGAYLKRRLEESGLSVRLNAVTKAIEGDDSVLGLRFDDGDFLPADLVVMAVGIRPEISLAKPAGLATGRGIIINDAMATTVEGIYALGECAEHRGQVYGLVEPAYEQAALLAKHFHATAPAFEGWVPSTSLKVAGTPVFSAGRFAEAPETEEIVYDDPGRGIYKRLILEADKLIGCVLLTDIADGPWYRELITSGQSISEFRSDLIFGRDFVQAA